MTRYFLVVADLFEKPNGQTSSLRGWKRGHLDSTDRSPILQQNAFFGDPLLFAAHAAQRMRWWSIDDYAGYAGGADSWH